ncbi:MAG: glycosyltransferase [Gammaproteobacteria bacterium]|nr:MAG: glycosyltransferase [Gammaproteobacteria bacterium]
MNILFLTKSVIDHHNFSRSFQLARGLAELGHEVTFVAASVNGRGLRETRDGVNLVAFPDPLPYRIKKGGLSPIDIVSRLWYLWSKDFDLVHVETGYRPVTGIVGHFYAWRKNIPYVCEWWDWIGRGGLYDRKSFLYRCTLGLLDDYFEEWDKKHADGVISVSEVLKQRAISIGIPESRIRVIHGGADRDLIREYDKRQCREQFGFPQDAFLACYAGVGSHEAYDLEPFLIMAKKMKQKHPNFGWYGTGGALKKDVRERFGVGEEYFEGGWVDGDCYGAYLACADVFLLPLQDDLFNRARWPNKLGDYLAVGSPILATPVGELREFSKRFPGVLSLVEWNEGSLMNAIEEWMRNPERADALKEKQRLIACGEYAWLEKSKQLEQFYFDVLQK